jgi:hypothetical protein
MIQQDLNGNEMKLLMTDSAASKTFTKSPGKKKEKWVSAFFCSAGQKKGKGVRALFCSAGQKKTRPEPG